jgi:hypothetical protein
LAFKLQSADDIFPTPLLRFDVADADKLNRALLKEIAQRQAAEGGMTEQSRGWHSEQDLFERRGTGAIDPCQADSADAGAVDETAAHTDFNNVDLLADGWIKSIRAAATVPARSYRQPGQGLLCEVPVDAEGQAARLNSIAAQAADGGFIEAPITARRSSFAPMQARC